MSPFSRSGSFIFLADSQPVPPELPEQIAARLREDAIAEKLAAWVLHWLPAIGNVGCGGIASHQGCLAPNASFDTLWRKVENLAGCALRSNRSLDESLFRIGIDAQCRTNH
jgi:hypothetical protein